MKSVFTYCEGRREERYLRCVYLIKAEVSPRARLLGQVGTDVNDVVGDHAQPVPYDPLHRLSDLSGVGFKGGARRSDEQIGIGGDCKWGDEHQDSVYAHEYLQP